MQVKRDITLDIMNDKTNCDNINTPKFVEEPAKKCLFCPYCGRKKYKKNLM